MTFLDCAADALSDDTDIAEGFADVFYIEKGLNASFEELTCSNDSKSIDRILLSSGPAESPVAGQK